MTEVRSVASRIEVPCDDVVFSKAFLDLHDAMNPQTFDSRVVVPYGFDLFVDYVYTAMGQPKPDIVRLTDLECLDEFDDKRVLLGFSGGLDSVAQLLLLQKMGYDVIPYSIFNVNFYSNGQENKACEEICSKLGIELVKAKFIRCMDKHNSHRKFWQENPIKNQMILATMVDYAIENGIGNISLGDDLGLPLSEAVVGTNITDVKEVTKTFLVGLKANVPNLKFLPMDRTVNKLDRIMLLKEHGLSDLYYSCVGSGRLNGVQHERYCKKFGVELMGRNCCSCRKCCHHNLLLHYGGKANYPDAMLRHCWEKLGAKDSADNVLFDPGIPIERRIKNLFEY